MSEGCTNGRSIRAPALVLSIFLCEFLIGQFFKEWQVSQLSETFHDGCILQCLIDFRLAKWILALQDIDY
jgi:hypothetical protein